MYFLFISYSYSTTKFSNYDEEEVRREENTVGPMAKKEEEVEVGSSLTMERVAVAKQYIESHYKA